MESIALIGDIEVLADEYFLKVTVDQENALFMSRDAEDGLQELLDALSSLIRKEK